MRNCHTEDKEKKREKRERERENITARERLWDERGNDCYIIGNMLCYVDVGLK